MIINVVSSLEKGQWYVEALGGFTYIVKGVEK